jgi:hypothetical protein
MKPMKQIAHIQNAESSSASLMLQEGHDAASDKIPTAAQLPI